MKQAMKLKSLTAPKFRYSQVVKAGPHYFCSGMLGLDNDSGELVGEAPGEQARSILANLRLLMEELGLNLEDLVIARIFTTRLDRFGEINAAWEEVFDGTVTPPARTSIGVAALPLGACVEIEFTFYKD